VIADKNHYLIKPLLVISCLGFLAIWLWRLAIVWFSSPEYIVATVPDDAFYYLNIARNISQGAGSTFDNISYTNGYHPLWLMMESAISLLSGTFDYTVSDGLLFLRVMLTTQLGLGLTAVFILAKALFSIDRSGALSALGVAVMGTPFFIYAMTDGMESGLVILFLSSLFLLYQKLNPLRQEVNEKDLAFGAFLSLGLMARLDLAFLILAIGIATTLLWVTKSLPKWTFADFLKKGIAWGIPVVLTLALYLFINSLHFDTLTPISGQLKNHFPTMTSPGKMILSNLPYFLLGLIGLLASVVLYTISPNRSVNFYSIIACLYLLLHGGSIFLYTNWGVHKWHFTAWWIIALLTSLLLFRHILSQKNKVLLVGIAVPLLLIIAVAGQWLFLKDRAQFAFQTQSYTAALWARENLSESSTIAMSDCGTFAFFYNGVVINLDGVVNNKAYQESLRDEGIGAYLDQQGAGYLAHHAITTKNLEGYRSYPYDTYSHLFQTPGGVINLKASAEQYRSAPFHDGISEKVFVLWKRPIAVKITSPARERRTR
jgi:hypothetical protein